mgnify:CR=1 FL=1
MQRASSDPFAAVANEGSDCQETDPAEDGAAGQTPSSNSSRWIQVQQMAQNIPGLKVERNRTDDALPGLADERRAQSLDLDDLGRTNEVRFSLLDSLPPKQAEACVSKMTVVEFAAGENIVDQGSVGTTMVSMLHIVCVRRQPRRTKCHLANASLLAVFLRCRPNDGVLGQRSGEPLWAGTVFWRSGLHFHRWKSYGCHERRKCQSRHNAISSKRVGACYGELSLPGTQRKRLRLHF